jgi:hypothetical protein
MPFVGKRAAVANTLAPFRAFLVAQRLISRAQPLLCRGWARLGARNRFLVSMACIPGDFRLRFRWTDGRRGAGVLSDHCCGGDTPYVEAGFGLRRGSDWGTEVPPSNGGGHQ